MGAEMRTRFSYVNVEMKAIVQPCSITNYETINEFTSRYNHNITFKFSFEGNDIFNNEQVQIDSTPLTAVSSENTRKRTQRKITGLVHDIRQEPTKFCFDIDEVDNFFSPMCPLRECIEELNDGQIYSRLRRTNSVTISGSIFCYFQYGFLTFLVHPMVPQ